MGIEGAIFNISLWKSHRTCILWISPKYFFYFERIFFSILKKLKTLKMALKLGLFSNNSPIVMKNDFYCSFQILNMFLSSKMTFFHFWGYPFLPKLTFPNNLVVIIKPICLWLSALVHDEVSASTWFIINVLLMI